VPVVLWMLAGRLAAWTVKPIEEKASK